jgi:UDP-3-O-[3-hydroxymyristoyl] glucosamine N-acyltransferase LpxD
LGVDFQFEGSGGKVQGAASIGDATESDLAFCWYAGEKGASYISKSKAGVILCKSEMQGITHPNGRQLLIFTDNPRLTFVRVLNEMQGQNKLAGISQRAVISEKAKIGANCYVGDYVVIGDNCVIGDNTVIYDRVSLVQNCIIGSNCLIQSGVSMGSDGFAFERHRTGRLEKFPHRGYVRIGDNVEIYTNCSIARGSLSDTIIGGGTKLDALVHIAHNVRVGKDCELTAGTIIGGSTTVGDTCWTGLNSTLKNKINVGNNVIVASGASVIHDVPDGDIVAGVPAKSIKDKVRTDELFLMAGQEESKKTSVA